MTTHRFVLLLTDGTTVESNAHSLNAAYRQHGLTINQARPLSCWEGAECLWDNTAAYALEAADLAPKPKPDRSNEISLTQHDSGEGWGHGVWFGGDSNSGWVLECDMENGKLVSAFTPAGTDPLFLMQVEGPPSTGIQRSHIVITVERDDVEWDPIARTLTIRDDR